MLYLASKLRPAMDHPTTTVQRLGQLLHWAGIIIGLLLGYGATSDNFSTQAVLITVAVCFLVPFLIGRAALHVLAGE
jgi:hypothetical protein